MSPKADRARRRSWCPKAIGARRRLWCPKAIGVCTKAIGSPKAIDIVPDGDWQPEGMCMPEGSCWLTESGTIELTADPAGADMTAAAGRRCPPRTNSNCATQRLVTRGQGGSTVCCKPWLYLVGRQLWVLSPSADCCRAVRHPTACPERLTPGWQAADWIPREWVCFRRPILSSRAAASWHGCAGLFTMC